MDSVRRTVPNSAWSELDQRTVLEPGSVFGRYRIDRLLGQGGMGAVYAAEELEDGRVVALKVLNRDLENPETRQRFLREGRLAASVNHPNVVYVFGTETMGLQRSLHPAMYMGRVNQVECAPTQPSLEGNRRLSPLAERGRFFVEEHEYRGL